MNSSAPLFTDTGQIQIVKKQRADLYSRIYQYAAQDFVSQADMKIYIESVTAWMKSVETEISTLMATISSHTHVLIPHVHLYDDNGSPAITGPEVAPLMTLVPIQAPVIKWIDIPEPVFINTTLTPPNYSGNRVMLGIGSEGDAVPELLRMLPIPITQTPLLPPVLQITI
jgi:hypothetical protein